MAAKGHETTAKGPESAQSEGAILARGPQESATFIRGPRLRHRLEVKKDDVQAVIPISKVIYFAQ
jgi:hypothetical protein